MVRLPEQTQRCKVKARSELHLGAQKKTMKSPLAEQRYLQRQGQCCGSKGVRGGQQGKAEFGRGALSKEQGGENPCKGPSELLLVQTRFLKRGYSQKA